MKKKNIQPNCGFFGIFLLTTSPVLLLKHHLIFLSILSPNLSLHLVSFLSFFYAFSNMHVNYTLQKKSVKFQWEWFISVTSVVPLPQCSTGGQDMSHKFKDGGEGAPVTPPSPVLFPQCLDM